MSINFFPDFIIIPYPVLVNENLTPQDKEIFGIIYWFEHLKDGRCTASNKTIADILKISHQNTVGNSLTNLEKNNFIKRIFYKDGQRKEIKTSISYKKVNPQSNDAGGQSIDYHNNNKQIINNILSKDNMLPTTQKSVPSKDNDFITVRNKVAEYFTNQIKEREGIEPEINYSQLTIQLKKFLKKYTKKQLKSLIDFYLDCDRFKEHGPNLGVVFSAYTINLWLHQEEAVA